MSVLDPDTYVISVERIENYKIHLNFVQIVLMFLLMKTIMTDLVIISGFRKQ